MHRNDTDAILNFIIGNGKCQSVLCVFLENFHFLFLASTRKELYSANEAMAFALNALIDPHVPGLCRTGNAGH